MKVGIGIAHYPEAPGACSGDFCEHAESSVWTTLLSQNLANVNIGCFVADVGKLGQKVKQINAADCDIAIEIHFNGGGDARTRGAETLYCPGSTKGKRLARLIQAELFPAMKTIDRGIKEGWYKMDRPGVEDYAGDVEGDEKIDYFLRKTNCPAVIIEPNFIQQRANIVAQRVPGVHAILAGIKAYATGGRRRK